MVKSRPESSPHYKTELGIDGRTPTLREHRRRRLVVIPGGQEDFGLLGTSQIEVSAEPQTEPAHRSFWFKKGTVLYSIDFPIPRSPLEAQNRQAQVLEEAQLLQIDAENLVYSENIARWRIKAKKEHKSKLFGAFVLVNIHTQGRRGEDLIIKRFASLKDLQKPQDNPLARFKMANR